MIPKELTIDVTTRRPKVSVGGFRGGYLGLTLELGYADLTIVGDHASLERFAQDIAEALKVRRAEQGQAEPARMTPLLAP